MTAAEFKSFADRKVKRAVMALSAVFALISLAWSMAVICMWPGVPSAEITAPPFLGFGVMGGPCGGFVPWLAWLTASVFGFVALTALQEGAVRVKNEDAGKWLEGGLFSFFCFGMSAVMVALPAITTVLGTVAVIIATVISVIKAGQMLYDWAVRTASARYLLPVVKA
jgi:hypothetical protein